MYATASLWLTDYLIAANLQAAYEAQAAANAAAANAAAANAPPPAEGAAEAGAQTPLTPEVKQAIADEVQRQLAAKKAAAAAPQGAAPAPTADQVPDALNPAERVFVVAYSLDVTVPATGQECSLTAGDVVMRLADAPDANQTVTASIQSTKKADCPTGQTAAIGVQDLQEMHNQFQAQLDAGLKTLADKGGTGGLPKPPDTATTGGEVPPPAPDPSAADQLAQQRQQAEQTVAEVQQQIKSGQGPTAMAQNAAIPSLKDQLEAQYTLTRAAAKSGQLTVIQPGTVLVVQLGGIQGVPPGSLALAPAVFKDGVLHPPGRKSAFGASVMLGISRPGSETSGVSNARALPAGERVYVTNLDVNPNKDNISFHVVECDPCNGVSQPSSFQGEVIFQFPKGSLANPSVSEIEDTIAKVFTIDTLGRRAEAQGVAAQVGQTAAAAAQAAPAQIQLGQSVDDVVAALGQPEKIVDLGAKKIYVYRDLRITFTNGKVSHIE